MVRRSVLAVLAVSGAAGSVASGQVIRGGELYYPPDAEIPRYETKLEKWWRLNRPQPEPTIDAVTPPPVGPIQCVAEYEPMESIMISWTGSSTWLAILAQMGAQITTTGNADLVVQLPSAGTQASANSSLTSAGANMARVRWVTPPSGLNSIWVRDYGPRYIYEGNVRAIVDHKYNRSTRLADDASPLHYGAVRGHAIYELGLGSTQLVHGGGNFHLDALDRGYATRLINNENPSFTETQIKDIWGSYQGLNMHLFDPFPISVDATQHLDMWMQIIADDKVIISDWPNNAGSTQDIICDNAVPFMQSRGYTVYRTPAYSISGIHYTYTNMVMCNNLVLLPTYTATPSTANGNALAVLQTALPGKTIVQVPCQNIVSAAGVMHCIVMHIPAHKGAAGPNGGLSPTAYLQSPNGGAVYTQGQNVSVRWLADDDLTAVNSADILLSTDGGATFPTVVAANITGRSFNWTTPAINTASARLRVIVRDAAGNTGSDDSDANFTIGSPSACYANCDNSTTAPVLNVGDFSCFLTAFSNGQAYANCDGSTEPPVLNVGDFSCFLAAFSNGCP